VSLTQVWLRQSFGAAGASLLAPLAVLVAAGVLVAGGGLGGLSGLGQITSGPSLPGSDVLAGSSGIEQADIVGAEITTPTTIAGAPSVTGLTGAPGTGAFTGAPGADQVPSPLLQVPSSPGGGGGGGTAPTPSPVQLPSGAPGPGSVEQVVGQTRGGLQTTLPEPLKLVTEDILNRLLGPPR
jgi:hypothetical protein